MVSTRIRRNVARVVSMAAVAGFAMMPVSSQANEVTIGGADPCNTSVLVWWNVPPDPGQRPAGFTVTYDCLMWDGPNVWEYLPSTTPLPVTVDLPIEP